MLRFVFVSFLFLSGSPQIVSVGKHVKGYHYIMANLVRDTPACLIAVCLCLLATLFIIISAQCLLPSPSWQQLV